MNLQKMTKKQIDNHAKTLGVTLDGRKSKKDMIAELNKATKKKAPAKKKAVAKKAPAKKKAVAKKAPAKIVGKPTSLTKKKAVYVAPKLSFFGKVKKFLNL